MIQATIKSCKNEWIPSGCRLLHASGMRLATTEPGGETREQLRCEAIRRIRLLSMQSYDSCTKSTEQGGEETNMQRRAFALQMKKGAFEGFRQTLKNVWGSVTVLLDEIGAHNFSLWQIEDLVFGYYETEGEEAPVLTQKQKELYHQVMTALDPHAEWISPPDSVMRLMYEDFGIVRDHKELIRHRVFVTRLKGDFQEEYKARHDALILARDGTVDPGPDSNFSIWNAGRYIFGYDEIDVTMEKAETQESREETIRWETGMLEIMEWLTDDVDWITGLHHSHIQRIGYHN